MLLNIQVISGTFPVRAEGLRARGQVFHKYYTAIGRAMQVK